MAKVIVYSTETCTFCTMAMDFLKEHNVKFEHKDVSSDSAALKEMMQKSRQGGVPVIDIDGKIIVGFNEPAIKEALGL
jgi:glutaredoxin-like YruB-family protein